MAIKLIDPTNGHLLWAAHPRQEVALTCTESEILYGGARGGGKTAAGIIWLLLGNDVIGHPHSYTVADAGYYLHPRYRALILRKNVTDMADWIAEAKQIYGADGKSLLGATYTARPCQFEFPSGATLVVGHLDDDDAYEKYQGHQYTRVLVEELTQIKSEVLYQKVLASCRCVFDELHEQVFCTANPGGNGGNWVRERFVRCTSPGTRYTDPATGSTRIFIPAGIKDNPALAENKQYIATLMGLPPALRRAWLDGDWDAISGQAFEEFRLRPLDGEPTEACHVVESTSAPLQPWYHQWLSCDWGYGHNAAVYRFCVMPSGQIHVTDEMVVNRTTPEELGTQIGQWLWPSVRSSTQKTWTLHLSPDAFSKRTDERTIADQMAVGLEKILGTDSVFILPAEHGEGAESIFSRRHLQTNASVVIQRAQNQRVAGWMFTHELLRWWPLLGGNGASYDPAFALKLYETDRPRWMEYCALFKTTAEVLPRLQIHSDKCPRLVAAIPKAMSQDPDKGDPNDIEKVTGDDEVDALRYGLMGYRYTNPVEPFEVFFTNHMTRFASKPLSELSGQSKVMMARKAEEKYRALTEQPTKALDWRRSSARQRRRGTA